jgi:cell division protease FtsH
MKISNRIVYILSVSVLTSFTVTQAQQPASTPVQQESTAAQQSNSVPLANKQADLAASNQPQNVNSADTDPLANMSPEEIEQAKIQIAKVLDAAITQIITQTERIEEVLQDLSMCISTGSIGKKDNKIMLLEQIKALRAIITTIKKNTFVNVDPSILIYLLAFNDALIEHIGAAIKNGLNSMPTFDPAGLQTRMEAISLDQIDTKLAQNEEQLIKLKIASQEIGLSWFNKTFRKFTNFLVILHHKKWDSALFRAALIGAVITHYVTIYTKVGYTVLDHLKEKLQKLELQLQAAHTKEARLDYKNEIAVYNLAIASELNPHLNLSSDQRRLIENARALYHDPFWFTSLARRCIGKPAIIGVNDEIINREDVGIIGKLDHQIHEVAGVFSHAYLPIIALLYGSDWPGKLFGWFIKRLDHLVGKMQGGVAAQKADSEIDESESQEPQYTFDDVVGLDHIKAILTKVLEYIKCPERFDRAQIPPERGYLFTGLPGTGKSFVAEAFGGEIRKVFKAIGRSKDELGFYSFSAEIINKNGFGWLLNLAKKEAPCVIFIDEIDLLCLQRGSNNNSVLLSEFLSSMSGVLSRESGKQVVILAATNRPEHLDRALRRRGRFGKVVHFELPTIAERRAFFVKKLSPLLPDISAINIDRLAEQTEGRTYEELAAMTNSAFQTTKISGQILTQEHLERALDDEIRRVINKDMHVSEQEQELIAAHQAGHAITRMLLKTRKELAAVTIKPINMELQDESAQAQYYGPRKQQDIQYGDTFTKCSFDHLEIYTQDEKIKECKIMLAGMIAEKILIGSCGHSYHNNDKQEALDLVKSMIFEGLHPQTMPKEIQLKYFEKALEQLKVYETDVEALLSQHKAALQAIAHDLVTYKTLSESEIKALIEKDGASNSTPQNAVVQPA